VTTYNLEVDDSDDDLKTCVDQLEATTRELTALRAANKRLRDAAAGARDCLNSIVPNYTAHMIGKGGVQIAINAQADYQRRVLDALTAALSTSEGGE
jgi:hypothetical protein